MSDRLPVWLSFQIKVPSFLHILCNYWPVIANRMSGRQEYRVKFIFLRIVAKKFINDNTILIHHKFQKKNISGK